MLPFHPFLVAAYPVLALYAHNLDELSPAYAARPLALALIAAGVAIGLSWSFVRDLHRAALLASVALILLFSYGHIYPVLKPLQLLGEPIGRHRYLVAAWAGLLIAAAVVIRRQAQLVRLTGPLNIAAPALSALPLMQIAISVGELQLASREAADRRQAEAAAADAQRPDIYYIILDAYTGEAVLREFYGLDNRPFLAELEARGFYVARCSQSNYARTSLSLASSLNMAYIDDFFPHQETLGISAFIRQNAVRAFLEQSGYRVVAIDSGYPSTQWTDAQVFLRAGAIPALRATVSGRITEFEALLLRTTVAAVLIDAGPAGGLRTLVE